MRVTSLATGLVKRTNIESESLLLPLTGENIVPFLQTDVTMLEQTSVQQGSGDVSNVYFSPKGTELSSFQHLKPVPASQRKETKLGKLRMVTFLPGIGREATQFYKRLADGKSVENTIYGEIMAWIMFALLLLLYAECAFEAAAHHLTLN